MQRKHRWISIGWLLALNWSFRMASAQVVWIAAEVVDYRTHQPLAASWRWTDSTNYLLAQTSAGPGGYSGYVPARVRWVQANAQGYRPLRLPIYWLNSTADSLRFRFVLPAVPVDKPINDQPYFQSEQKPLQLSQQTPNQRSVAATIHILDVVSGQPVRAEVCLFFTRHHQKACYPATDLIQRQLSQPDIIALEVKAPGYQSYWGNLVIDTARTNSPFTYVVRLNPLPTLLMISTSEQMPISDIRLTPLGSNKSLTPSTTTPVWEVAPGKYRLNIKLQDGQLQTDTIDLKKGINGYVVATKISLHTNPSTRCDCLYFAQSSYDLSALAREQLDGLAARMRREPTRILQLVGHTDSVGNPQLNMILSEFRVKVTRTYLLQRGVQPARIRLNAAGDRQPAFPNDSELNRSRNRRVDMCLN